MANNLRADITGLRAVAVLAVTAFHIDYVLLPQVQFIPGGFLGVDIFFVISGYLMTMIIMRGLDQGNFSVLKFYQRRAKRICPALLLTVTVTFLFGLFVLSPNELEMLCRAEPTHLNCPYLFGMISPHHVPRYACHIGVFMGYLPPLWTGL